MAEQQLNQTINLQMTGSQQMVSAIQGVTKAFEKYAKTQDKTAKKQKQTKDSMTKLSDQGIANIQAGLVQLSTYLLNMNVKINNVFANMTKRFTEAEDAMAQLRITMGLTNAEARKVSGETGLGVLEDNYAAFEQRIDKLAATTEYSKKEVANAFTSLIQSGQSAKEALNMLTPTLQMATASAGQLGLAEAINVAALTVGTLGGEASSTGANLNMLLRVTQKSKIGFKDLEQTLGSLRATFTKFAKPEGKSGQTREAQLMALASIARNTGLSAANAGEKVDQFSRALLGLGQTLGKGEMRALTGSGKGRFSMKREALHQLFGLDSKSLQKLNKDFEKLGMKFGDVKLARDKFIQHELSKVEQVTDEKGKITGFKYQQLDAGTMVERLVANYAKLVAARGQQKADEITKSALGQEAAQFMLSAIAARAKKEGKDIGKAGEVFTNYVKELVDGQRDLANAEKEAMGTLSYKMRVLEGAQDALSNSIFKHDAYAQAGVETYKEMISASTTLMNNNEGLATSLGFMGRMMQLLTGFGTNMGFMLVASATFSMGLKHAQDITGKSTKSLGGTLRAFSTAFLNPTMLVVRQLAGGFFFLGLMIVATMRYVSGAEKGIGAGFRDVLNTVTNAAKALGGFINLAFNQDMQNKSVRKLVSDYQELKKEYQSITAEMRRLEAQGVRPTSKAMTDLQTKLEGVSADMKKTSDVLGESAVDGLAKIGHLGGGALVQSLAGVIDVLRALGRSAIIIFEAAIKPVMAGIESIFFILGSAFQALFTFMKKTADALGYTSDEASFLKDVLEGVGYFLGAMITGFLATKAFNIFVGSLRLVKNTVVGAKNAVVDYSKNVRRISKSDVSTRQLNGLEKLRLKWYAVTGQSKKYGNEIKRIKNTNFKSLLGSVNNLGLGLVGAGITASTLVSQLGGEEWQGTADSIMNYTMGLSAIVAIWPVLSGIFTAIKAFFVVIRTEGIMAGVGMLAAFWPVLLALTGIYVAYKLLSSAFGGKKEESSASPVEKATTAAKVLPGTSTPSAVASAMSGTSNIPTGDFSGSAVTPMTSSMTRKGTTTDFGGGSGGYIPPSTPQKHITINQKINVKSVDPEKAGREIAKQTKRTLSSEDSFAFD